MSAYYSIASLQQSSLHPKYGSSPPSVAVTGSLIHVFLFTNSIPILPNHTAGTSSKKQGANFLLPFTPHINLSLFCCSESLLHCLLVEQAGEMASFLLLTSFLGLVLLPGLVCWRACLAWSSALACWGLHFCLLFHFFTA